MLGEAGKPYDKQIEILQAVIGNRRVTVVGCNGSGKDWTTARIVLRVEEVIEMWGINTMQISGKVIEQVRRHGIRSVYVDGIGIGAG